MIQEIITSITSWVTGLVTLILQVVTSMVDLFYDSTADKLTVIGMLALFGLAFGLINLGN